MSLATRCITCGTVFRVVEDQLQISDGWVRCGRCDQVFNAMEGLFDLAQDPSSNEAQAHTESNPQAAKRKDSPKPQAHQSGDDIFHLSDEERIQSRFFHPEQTDVDHSPADALPDRERVEFADAEFNVDMLADAATVLTDRHDTTSPIPTRPPVHVSRSKSRSKSKSRSRAKSEPSFSVTLQGPTFLHRANEAARWNTPQVRMALMLSAIVFLAVLTTQVAMHFRDFLATKWPQTRPLLTSGCEVFNCRISPLHRIDDLTVESSTLSPTPKGNAFKLSVVLRNRSSLALAMPWVDLSLTDAAGQLVARRVLSPTDFRITSPTIGARSESTIQLVLAVESRRVNGYTVEIFYP